MMKVMTKNYRTLVLAVSFLLLLGISSLSYAWFVLINRTDSFVATAAKVDVEYAIDLAGTPIELSYFTINSGYVMVKTGVFRINTTDPDAANYLANLRINIVVKSTVDTYIRVSIIDSPVLLTQNFEGELGEVAIVDQPTPYAFDRTWLVNDVFYQNLSDAEIALGGITASDTVLRQYSWFDNRLNDGYHYYPHRILRNTQSTPLVIPFIEAYDGFQLTPKSFGYSLQFAIIVEAIQANHQAPMINWGLPTPPWGGEWL